MDPITLGVLALTGLVALGIKRKASSLAVAEPTPKAPPSTGTLAAGGGAASALSGTKLGAEITATVTAAIVGFGLGQAADKALLGGDSDATTQLSGGLAGGLIAGAGVLLAFGTLTGPIFAAVVAFALFAYTVVAIIDDFSKLAYGQAGAKRDFRTHLAQVHEQCYQKLRVGADPKTPDAVLERKLQPFHDGYMREINRLAYVAWMKAPKGITQLGLDSQGKAEHGAARGYFVGNIFQGSTTEKSMGELSFPEEEMLPSAQPLWTRKFCPPNEILWEPRFIPRYGSTSKATQLAGTNYDVNRSAF